LKIANDVAIAVDQLGTRKGAIAVYIEPWHIDIRDFLDLKKNSGEERRRAHDLFPALWINDLFMKRVAEDSTWTLFDPYETAELSQLYGEEFEKRYEELEKSEEVTKEIISAKALWKEILRSYFETGNPFLCFKDSANRANPNRHAGMIRSSNLCTEIFQNTAPNHYRIKVIFEDETISHFEEEELVETDCGVEKPAKKITALDTIDGKRVWMVEKEALDGDTAVCNLASVNLSKVNTPEDIARVVPVAVRMLDNVIDLNFYPLSKVKKTNMKSRAIGLGVMGEAQMLAEARIEWGSNEHFHKIDEVMESVSYYAIRASSDLALEKGRYPLYEGSDWSKGIFPIDKANPEACKLVDRGGLFGYTHDWHALKEKVVRDGMRNGYLMAIAPTSSISILTGTTQAIEPVYKRKWYEENLSGLIPVVVPNLSPETWHYYTPSYELDQRVLIRAGAIRQKWIDQGQSLNIFISLDKASGRYLNEIYMEAWKFGLKSTYYLRSQSPEAIRAEEGVEDRSLECVGCQ
jgi:ribonucleoside-diphosphate reductase alpha chain